MIRFKLTAIPLVLGAVLAACQGGGAGEATTAPEVPAINVAHMDTSVDPGEDFFMYVNGNWVKNTEIPDDQVRWGSFNELSENTQVTLLDVLNNATNLPAASDEQKAIDFYQSGMDSMAIEEAGLAPLQPVLDQIAGIETKKDLQSALQEMHQYSSLGLFSFYVRADLKNSTINTAYFSQSGLGLPDKDYYFREGTKSDSIRQAYVAHVSNMLTLAGLEGTEAKAQQIMDLETRLAAASMDRAARRNTDTLYNKYSVAELGDLVPAMDWDQYFASLNTAPDTVIVMMPVFFQEMAAALEDTPVEVWKSYLSWHWLRAASRYLPHAYVSESFDFYNKTIRGQKEMRDRWKRILSRTNRSMGEPLGKLYVAEVFPPEAKATAKEMVDNIVKGFGQSLEELEWMGPETKVKAREKLNSFTVKIGYPDKWRDYSAYEVSADKVYAANYLAVAKAAYAENLADLGKPVDKTRWGMSPQTVNAYYNPSNNEIVFPAAILQPPFYNYKADVAVNYGGIGAVIGHEISHGFDDQGSRFDAEGNLKNWWQEADKEEFKSRTGLIIDQYESYTPIAGDSIKVNGKLTLGENIADFGGVSMAYKGLQLYLAENGRPEPIDGFTPEQRFFISWATVWRIKYRDDALRNQLMTDPHSPGMYRANGPLSNFGPFYEAFNVQEGAPMRRPEELRANIW